MSDGWACRHCGRGEHDAILVSDDGIEVDVTCQSVYFTPLNADGEYSYGGVSVDHNDFERIFAHYRSVISDMCVCDEMDGTAAICPACALSKLDGAIEWTGEFAGGGPDE